MEPIGERLRRRRAELGVTLREVEAATRIRLRYLEAIEDDRFDDMPADVFTKGFLRSYATYLGLDGNDIVADFKALHPSNEGGAPVVVASPSPGHARRRRRRPRRVRWTLPLLLAVLAAAGAALLHMRPLPVAPPRKAGAIASAPSTAPAAPSPRTSAPSPAAPPRTKLVAGTPQGTVLPFSVTGASAIDVRATFSGRCWVRVWIDGVLQQPDVTYASGRSAVWRARHTLRILLGYPRAASLTVDGTPLAVHSQNPRTLSLTLARS